LAIVHGSHSPQRRANTFGQWRHEAFTDMLADCLVGARRSIFQPSSAKINVGPAARAFVNRDRG